MLRAGNRHLEKQLYPNRLERYTRRFVRVAERVVKNGYRRIKQFVAERRPLSNETNVSIHPQKMAAHPLKTKVDATKIVRIPRKPIKQVEGMEQKRSRRI
ncbi:MAG: hypothetical protein DI598_18500 [Pseudopedobacter saltans]|uniref:Uncharacterized protein n=1 Tax=Pseudopedobacter saltans TaxID=151895 RepID=A0A2W5EJ40_9SPHI|nr:MAG: hypothetical protein DI598_18500 [Pseudopedobacter saltans]